MDTEVVEASHHDHPYLFADGSASSALWRTPNSRLSSATRQQQRQPIARQGWERHPYGSRPTAVLSITREEGEEPPPPAAARQPCAAYHATLLRLLQGDGGASEGQRDEADLGAARGWPCPRDDDADRAWRPTDRACYTQGIRAAHRAAYRRPLRSAAATGREPQQRDTDGTPADTASLVEAEEAKLRRLKQQVAKRAADRAGGPRCQNVASGPFFRAPAGDQHPSTQGCIAPTTGSVADGATGQLPVAAYDADSGRAALVPRRDSPPEAGEWRLLCPRLTLHRRWSRII
ncbi:hypothetical protein STCU_12209 [Strigomonas culicis]|uniref:Uncharacterized protein n=1 Tax=Strigomonas culicis TaxID=28005 RepID=S9TB68_9TRYP|nr:hypothetical protein STCU_12209 [Strigomonas culicis]|eukprot:EPY15242.1 hypothetical protein STCU_12209 [Strigomonas culicis]